MVATVMAGYEEANRDRAPSHLGQREGKEGSPPTQHAAHHRRQLDVTPADSASTDHRQQEHRSTADGDAQPGLEE
jgi:hypothetical protein